MKGWALHLTTRCLSSKRQLTSEMVLEVETFIEERFQGAPLGPTDVLPNPATPIQGVRIRMGVLCPICNEADKTARDLVEGGEELVHFDHPKICTTKNGMRTHLSQVHRGTEPPPQEKVAYQELLNHKRIRVSVFRESASWKNVPKPNDAS